mgnify:FL=1
MAHSNLPHSPTNFEVADPSPGWWRPATVRLLPGAILIIFLTYYWRINNLATLIPAYGDVLEALWGIDWLLNGFRNHSADLLFDPNVFMPEGWSTVTFAFGPGLFVLALPIAAATNIAVALNVLHLASFFIAFFGAYLMGRLVVGRPIACLIALLYLLWGGRWLRVGGQLNVLLASALIPWLILFLEKSLTPGRRWPHWAVAAALIWALAISVSLYFIWVGLLLIAAWLLGATWDRRITLRRAILQIIVIGGTTVLICAPYLYLYWRGLTNIVSYDIRHINSWSLSVNWLPALYPGHPIAFLEDLARWQLNGVRLESAYVGFGVILTAIAVFGLVARGRRPIQWRGILLTISIGILLALGPTLHWGGKIVPINGLQPINEWIWSAGHALKPEIFTSQDVLPEFATAIPLPGLILSALVPFFEGARVPARFLLLAAPGILLLAGIGLERISKQWLRYFVLVLLLIEAARMPLVGVPFPPPSHPVFAWLANNPLSPGESVLDVRAISQNIQIPSFGGPTIWATLLHGQPIASGGGSMLPVHTDFLLDWLTEHPDPENEEEFPWLLRGYGIRYVLLHMDTTPKESIKNLAEGTSQLMAKGCFEAAPEPPWNYPICVLEVAPPEMPAINIRMAGNWSDLEEWGIWAMGRESRVRWVSTNDKEARFAVEAFPLCVEGKPQQQVDFVVDDQIVASHRWDSCDAWRGEIAIPPGLVQAGWNEMVLQFARSDRPVDVTDGQNPDSRELSVGFSRFELLP